MDQFKIMIDGISVETRKGQTILQAAASAGIRIPTLCYDERTEQYGGCGICVVEVKGNPKMVKSCSTLVSPDMEVMTNTDRVYRSRKMNLELLLSNHTGDCQGPCMKNCPANTDCQGYVGLIANGKAEEALKLIKEKIPLPASIGRVCPHPCETACRRGLVDEPIDIANIKRFAGDFDLQNEVQYIPEIPAETGKKAAIVGGGPYGLSQAYFLRRKGHSVTIFESMPQAGGMLRYGIPQYRLPKEVLDQEIAVIEKMGVKIRCGVRIGREISLEDIRRDFDVVCMGIGAWKSSPVGCAGEEATGVLGGIDFLRNAVMKKETGMGKKVAVVGGGNTAMDACRTAVRLGAEKVYNVYRRTVEEMPAERIEIREAEEEGVIFRNLVSPAEILSDDAGNVSGMRLQVMELGPAGDDGRRKPIPVDGKFEFLEVDTVIAAIGQAVEGALFPELELTKKKAIKYDKDTFRSNLEGVFVGGDCGNDKISIAVEAIADAHKSADLIDAYLNGEAVAYRKEYTVEREDITAESFEDRERMFRQAAEVADPEERKDNFREVASTFSREQAVKEASRCLECGCQDYHECRLVDFANEYGMETVRFNGDKTEVAEEAEKEAAEERIIRDQKKCISCGLCVRVCHELVGAGAIGLVNRGFDTVIEPELGKPLSETDCIACGQCIAVCPTGALREGTGLKKPVPLKTEQIKTTCGFCPVGCEIIAEVHGDIVVKISPDLDCKYNDGIICSIGKFGYFDLAATEEAEEAEEAEFCESGEACDGEILEIHGDTISELIESVAEVMGTDAVLGIYDNATDEEIAEAKAAAEKQGMKLVGIRDDFKDGDPLFLKAVDLMNQRRRKAGLPEFNEADLMTGCNARGLAAAGIQYADFFDADVILPYGDFLKRKGSFTNIDGTRVEFRPVI